MSTPETAKRLNACRNLGLYSAQSWLGPSTPAGGSVWPWGGVAQPWEEGQEFL
jgi:hypothetical protein